MKGLWPCHYAGVEPFNKRRQDWRLRYAAAFQLVPSAEGRRKRGRFDTVDVGTALVENESMCVSDAR